MSVSEYIASALRAQKIVLTDAKRCFMASIINYSFFFIYHQDIKINAYNALLICALILIFVTIIQIWLSNLNNILSSDIHIHNA